MRHFVIRYMWMGILARSVRVSETNEQRAIAKAGFNYSERTADPEIYLGTMNGQRSAIRIWIVEEQTQGEVL